MTSPDHLGDKNGKIDHHKATGFAYLVMKDDGKPFAPPFVYTGADAAVKCLEKLFELQEELLAILNTREKLNVTPELVELRKNATNCGICGKAFQ